MAKVRRAIAAVESLLEQVWIEIRLAARHAYDRTGQRFEDAPLEMLRASDQQTVRRLALLVNTVGRVLGSLPG